MPEEFQTLGYHTPGDYHFFLRVADSDRFLGDGTSSFKDLASVVGLVTGLHEHVHLVQSRTSGYCLWLESVKDELADAVASVLADAGGIQGSPAWDRPDTPPRTYQGGGSAFDLAVSASYNLEQAEQFLRADYLTASLLDRESEDAPILREVFPPEARNLTTFDLLEAQAAMVAEWRTESLLKEDPERFDLSVLEKAAATYRLMSLPATYGKALRIFVHLFDRMGLQAPPRDDDMPARIPFGPLYPIVIYLIDYALHIPPEPLALRASFGNDTAALEDIFPPFRYLLLSLVLTGEMLRNPRLMAGDDASYSSTTELLAGIINSMHDTVRIPSQRSVEHQQRWPKSFFSLQETSDQWREAVRSGRHTLLSRLDAASIEFRSTHGWSNALTNSFLEIHSATGLPILRDTPKGLATVPFFSMKDHPTTEQIRERAEQIMQEWFAGPDWDRPSTDTPTGNPWPFLQQAADRRLDQDGAKLYFAGGPVRCPLTVGLGELLPCGRRRTACQSVDRVDDLPASGCRLRSRLENLGARVRRG